MQKIAIEGLVNSGKTSSISGLTYEESSTDLQCIAEYCEFVGGGQNFPGFPINSDAAYKSNQFFADLDLIRFATIKANTKVAIFDRSVLSVIAYHYATEMISKQEISCFRECIDFFQTHYPQFFPDILIYLSIDPNEVIKRHQHSGYYENVLLNKDFNYYLVDFYERSTEFFPQIKRTIIDGMQEKDDVLKSFKQRIDLLVAAI